MIRLLGTRQRPAHVVMSLPFSTGRDKLEIKITAANSISLLIECPQKVLNLLLLAFLKQNHLDIMERSWLDPKPISRRDARICPL